MVTQKLTIRLDESELPEIRMVSGDIGREIQIEVYAREDSVNPIDLETYSAEITLIKPDNTFIMDNFTTDKYELPEQAGAVSGSGYYQIKIFTAGDHQIYTGQGCFLVDDMILSDDVIESSSIAFGDRFPEDFATKEWVDDEIEAHGIGTYVAGNPADEETMPPLVRLQINDDIYPISHKIEEMEDADITTPAAGDVLTYNADDNKWKNEPLDIPDPTVTKTATGNPIEFTDGADAPLVKCVSAIAGYQSGSGTPSPDNIRPIVAYTEGEIEVRGKNLLDPSLIELQSNGYMWSNNYQTQGTISVEPSTTYTLCFDHGIGDGRIYFYDENGNSAGTTWTFTNPSTTFPTPSTCVSIGFRYKTDNNVTPTISNAKPMLYYGSSTATYEPYNPNATTHTTTYPSAIYRGSEDVVSGSVEYDMLCVNMGDLTWTREPTGTTGKYRFKTVLSGSMQADTVHLTSICSHYALVIAQSTYSLYEGYTITSNGDLYLYDSSKDTMSAADFITSMNGVYLVYTLSNPTTSSVTPTNLPIKSLAGYSHIESTTGEMEVEYITQQWDAITAAPKAEYHKLNSSAIAVPADPGIVVTLQESIYNYDELVITADPDSAYSGTYSTQQTVLTWPLEVGKSYFFATAPGVNMAIYFEVTSETRLTFLRGWQAYEYTITDLTGIKWR